MGTFALGRAFTDLYTGIHRLAEMILVSTLIMGWSITVFKALF